MIALIRLPLYNKRFKCKTLSSTSQLPEETLTYPVYAELTG